MDRYLKERLVGAAVLVAAAIILIPEMLSGPKEPVSESGRAANPDGTAVKTYTIDLAKPAVKTEFPTDAPQTAATESSAPSSVTPPPAHVEIHAVSPVDAPRESVAADVVTPAPESRPPASERAPISTSSASPAAVATAGAVGDWVVQVASMSAENTANRMASDLRAGGFAAFVTPVSIKGQTLYRVRVGPVATRESADALLTRVRTKYPDAKVAPR